MRNADPLPAATRTVQGMGYELVDVSRAARGLLQVTIDRVPGQAYAAASDAVTVEDCQAVTRQLQSAFEVEGVDYRQLEVSSPGLDRPLRRAADYLRFAGCEVALTLHQPMSGRKAFKGLLERAGEGWRLKFCGTDQALDFQLDEVREARLVPVLDFKGRGRGAAGGDGGQE